MDTCIDAILQSVAVSRKKCSRLKDNDRALLYRRVNSSVLGFLSDSGEDYRKVNAVEKVASVTGTVLDNVEQLLWTTCGPHAVATTPQKSPTLSTACISQDWWCANRFSYHANINTSGAT